MNLKRKQVRLWTGGRNCERGSDGPQSGRSPKTRNKRQGGTTTTRLEGKAKGVSNKSQVSKARPIADRKKSIDLSTNP